MKVKTLSNALVKLSLAVSIIIKHPAMQNHQMHNYATMLSCYSQHYYCIDEL